MTGAGAFCPDFVMHDFRSDGERDSSRSLLKLNDGGQLYGGTPGTKSVSVPYASREGGETSR